MRLSAHMSTTNPANALASGEIKLVKIHELARRYDVSVRCIQKWTSAGILGVHKFGRRCVRYDVAKCDAAIERFQTRAACLGKKEAAHD
jgi:hypothetical protein